MKNPIEAMNHIPDNNSGGMPEKNLFKPENINGANIEQEEKIDAVIARELQWLGGDEYVLRKMAATNMSEKKVKEDIERIKVQLAKTKINFLPERADLALGCYAPNKNEPIINIFKTDFPEVTLTTVDHEIKHALSEEALETMDDLIKVFASNYKKYPKINNASILEYFIPGETKGQWASRAAEQQVISKRIMDIMETEYQIKRGVKLTTDNLKQLISYLNNQIKIEEEKDNDVTTLLYIMKKKHKDRYIDKLCEMVNKAY